MLCSRGRRHTRAVRRLNRDYVHDRVACLYSGDMQQPSSSPRSEGEFQKTCTQLWCLLDGLTPHWPGVEVAEVAA